MKNKFCFANLRVSRRLTVPVLISAVFACALMQSKLQAANGTWNTNGNGNWSDTTKWASGTVANDNTSTANFTLDINADRTVTLDTSRTIRAMVFTDLTTASHNWILARSGTAVLTLAGTTPSISVTNQTATISGILTGSTAWSKIGGGTLVLSGTNTFTAAAAPTISDGTLRISNTAAFGAAPAILVSNVAPGSGTDTNALQLAGDQTFGAGKTVTLRSAVAGGQGRTSLTNQSGNNTWAGNIVFESPFNQALQSDSGTFTISGNITNGTPATTQFFIRGASGGNITGNINVGAAVPFKTDAGTWTISSTGNIHGPFGLSNGGIVVNNNNALYPLVPINFGEASGNTGTLTINAGFVQSTTGLTVVSGSTTASGHRVIGAGTLDLGWPTRTLTINNATAPNDLTISTPVTGVGGFLKTGTGRLVINGPSVEGPATVGAGLLAASGSFEGGITVQNGAALAAGNLNLAGTATTPTLAFGSGTTTLQLDVGATFNDLIQVTSPGGLTQAGTTTIEINPTGSFTVAVYPLISYAGTSPGLAGFTLGTLPSGITANLIDTGTAIALNVTAVQKLAWTGFTDGVWDTSVVNWDEIGGASGVTFASGDEVFFGNGPVNSTIDLVGTVDPVKVVFNNDATAYTLASGTLSGTGAMDLVKAGTGSLLLTNINTYTGVTDIQDGTLELDNDGGTLSASSGVVVGATATFKVTDDDGDIAMSRSLSGSGTVRVNPNTFVSAPAARNVTFSGNSPGFNGSIILESPVSGSTRLAASAAAVGTAAITVQNENQFLGTTGNTYTNNITITGDGYNDTLGSIGAFRIDGGTWNGTIAVTGTPGDSAGTVFDARIGANGGTTRINGDVSGGDLNVWSYNNAGSTCILAGVGSYGDLIIGGPNPGSGTGGGQSAVILGNNDGVPTNTTATFGSGDIFLISGTNATNPMDTILRINRADGYTLAAGQNITGSATTALEWGGVFVHVDTPGSGFSTGANTIDLSDGTNGGMIRVGPLTNGSIFNIDNGATIEAGNLHIGEAANNSVTVNQAAGSTVTLTNQFRVGHFGTETSAYNLNGGSLVISGGSPAVTPSTAGATEQNGGIYIGIDGQGILNQIGGSVSTNFVVLDNRGNSGTGANMVTGIDQYNLSGGSLELKSNWGIIQRNTSAELNLSGGTISISNAGTGTGTGPALTVPLDTLINVSGTGAVLDTMAVDNNFSLTRNVLGTGTLTVNGGGELQLNPIAAQTISAVIAGAGPVAKLGAFPTTVTSASTYSGATSVEVGALNVAGSLNNSDVSVFDAATIGGEGSVKTLTLGVATGSNMLIDGSTPGALTVNGALTHNGTTTVDFTGTPVGNTVTVLNYTGPLTGTGTFALANAANYRSSSFTDSGSVVTLNLDLKELTWTGTDVGSPTTWNIAGIENWTDGAAQKFYNGDSVTFNDTPGVNQTVNITGNVLPEAVTVNNSAIEYTIAGTAGNGIGGTASLTKSGTGTLNLAAPNTFAGPVSVTGGVVKLLTGGNSGLGASGNTITVTSPAQVNYNGIAPAAGTAYSFSIAGDGPDSRGALINETLGLNENARILNLTLTGNASVGAYGGVGDGNRFDIGFNGASFGTINGGGFTLTKVGPNMVNMRAPATNISYVISEGTLRGENSPLALGSNTVTVNGGRLDSWGTLSWAVPVDLATGTSLTSSSGTATWTGGLDITGDVTLGGGATSNVASVITGTGSLIKADAGRVILSAANTYSGTTTVAAGFLQANDPGAFNASTVQVTNTAAAGSIVVNGGVTLANDVVVGSGPTITGAVGRGLIESTGTGQGVYSGTITINSSPSGGGTFLGGGALGNELVFTGPVNVAPGIGISQRDGRVIFSGGGTATGSTFITTGVTTLGANEGIPSGVTLNPGGSGAATFEMAGFSQTLAGLTRITAQNTLVTNSAVALSTLNLDVTGTPSYSGFISGNLEINKLGTGTQELTAPNSYTGATMVTAGTLRVSNLSGSATGSGTVTVDGAGTLAGTGIIGGDVVVNGQVTPGVTTGDLTLTGNVSFAAGSTLKIDVNDASAPKKDLLAVAGTLSAAAATLDFDVTGSLAEPVYVVATYTGSAPAGFTAVDVPAGYVVDYDYNGNSIALVNAYLGWAAENGLTAGVNDGKLQDPDNDGVANVVEFATDGDPLSGEANGKIRSIITDVDSGAPVVNALTITLPVRTGAVFSGPGDQVSAAVDGILYRIQSSTNLSDFTSPNVTEVTDNAAILTQLSLPALSGPGWTYRTFRAPGTPGTDAKEFLRIVAE